MENTLVTTADVVHDPQRYLAAAANGHRFVLLGNDGELGATLIGADDLQRLVSLERDGDAPITNVETGDAHFRPRRHLLSATQWRTEMADRFAVWRQVTAPDAAA